MIEFLSIFLLFSPTPEIKQEMTKEVRAYTAARAITKEFYKDFCQTGYNPTTDWDVNKDGIIECKNGNLVYICSYTENNRYTVIFRLETPKRDYVHWVTSNKKLDKEEEDEFFNTVKWQILSLFRLTRDNEAELLSNDWKYPVDP